MADKSERSSIKPNNQRQSQSNLKEQVLYASDKIIKRSPKESFKVTLGDLLPPDLEGRADTRTATKSKADKHLSTSMIEDDVPSIGQRRLIKQGWVHTAKHGELAKELGACCKCGKNSPTIVKSESEKFGVVSICVDCCLEIKRREQEKITRSWEKAFVHTARLGKVFAVPGKCSRCKMRSNPTTKWRCPNHGYIVLCDCCKALFVNSSERRLDAMVFRVPGSFGSGKKS